MRKYWIDSEKGTTGLKGNARVNDGHRDSNVSRVGMGVRFETSGLRNCQNYLYFSFYEMKILRTAISRLEISPRWGGKFHLIRSQLGE